MKIRIAQKIVKYSYNRGRYDVEEIHPKRHRYMDMYKRAYHRVDVYYRRAIRKKRKQGFEFISSDELASIVSSVLKEYGLEK